MNLEAGTKVKQSRRGCLRTRHSPDAQTRACVRAIVLFVTPPLTCTLLIVFVNLVRNTRNSNGGRKKAVEPWKNCERTTNRDDGNSRCSRRCSYTRGVWSGVPRVNTAACCLCFRRPTVDDEPDFSKCFRKSVCNNVPLSSRKWWRLTFFLQLPCKVTFCWLKIV